MKRLAALAVLALAACATGSAPIAPLTRLAAAPDFSPETLRALGALCTAEATPSGPAAPDLKLVQGMGTGGFRVDTSSAEAQDWFNYGLALSHGFYHEDAKTAMRRSVAADPSCSLCAWGLAWSLGPTLNYGISGQQVTDAKAAADNALSLAKDERSRRLGEAIVARYTDRTPATEVTFGNAMKAIASSYPDTSELGVLAAHALLIPVRAGEMQGLKPALDILEAQLRAHPDDTGAIHYYIHATEFDGRAEDAIAYADRLGRLAPKASHLVHMPAHTFFHAGRYEDAALVNAQAIEADTTWLRDGAKAPAAGFLPMYYAHNLAFGLAGSLMAGDATLALKYADHAARVYPGTDLRPGTALGRTYVALARYAPDRALAIPVRTGDPKLDIYRHYARGEAFLTRGDVAGAREEARALRALPASIAQAPETKIAAWVIEGRIAMLQGNPRRAAQVFGEAARLQETQLEALMDPPAWWYPVRRSLAAAWLKAGDFAKAKADAEASLAKWKHDPLALWVLAKAEEGLGNASAAEIRLNEARRLWRGDFATITVETI
jgi:tetratricopeptide (TPR) repeat protein